MGEAFSKLALFLAGPHFLAGVHLAPGLTLLQLLVASISCCLLPLGTTAIEPVAQAAASEDNYCTLPTIMSPYPYGITNPSKKELEEAKSLIDKETHRFVNLRAADAWLVLPKVLHAINTILNEGSSHRLDRLEHGLQAMREDLDEIIHSTRKRRRAN